MQTLWTRFVLSSRTKIWLALKILMWKKSTDLISTTVPASQKKYSVSWKILTETTWMKWSH